MMAAISYESTVKRVKFVCYDFVHLIYNAYLCKEIFNFMTVIIVTILFVGFFLIATERLTNINKTAVAIFIGTLGWMLYVGNGSDYIMEQHPEEYMIFLGNELSSGSMIKQFIAQNIFLNM